MADDVLITPSTAGTAIPVAADNIAGVRWQRVKIGVGVDGVATDLAPGQGARAASLPVALSTEDAALLTALLTATPTVSGTVGVNNFPSLQAVSSTTLATASAQATAQTSLTSIDGKTPALGQALAAVSTPVVLTAAQVTALTPPAAITGFATETGNLATIAGKDFATQTTLAALNTKIPAAPATEGGNLATIVTNTGRIPAQGQALAAASTPVVLTAAQVTALTPPAAITGFATDAILSGINGTDITTPTAMPAGGAGVRGWLSAIWTKINGSLAVTGTFWQATQPVSGTITAQGNDGTTPRTFLTGTDGRMIVGGAVADGSAPTGNSVHVSGLDAGGLKRSIKTDTAGVVQIAGAVTAGSLPLPTGASTETTLAAQSAKLPATLGQKAMAASLAVVLASDQGAVPTKETRASTGTITSVAGSASTGVLLASNASRIGATIYNDSTAILYLALAATASATAYTAQLAASGGYYEVPANYTGVIAGIWASATGSARITEMS